MSVIRKPLDHFYCPILHVDEDVPWTKGQIALESLGGRSTVLQRTGVDTGLGAFFEAEAGDAVKHGLDGIALESPSSGDPREVAKIGRRLKIRQRLNGADDD